MDPASFALSVAAVAETAAKLVEFLHDLKDGGKQRIRLSAQISALWVVLENVKAQVEDNSQANTASMHFFESLAVKGGPLEQCRHVLGDLQMRLEPKRGGKGVLQALRWTFDKDEVNRYLESVNRLQNAINLTYAQATLSLLQDITVTTKETRDMIDSQEMQVLLDWISPNDFEAQHGRMFSTWCPGTVEWHLKTKAIEKWLSGYNTLLWIPGLAGHGKSILASLMIEKLRTGRNTQLIPTMGVYFSSRVNEVDFLRDTFASLLRQLVIRLGAFPDLRRHYRSSSAANQPLKLAEALQYIDTLLETHDRAFLVADGIDEVPTAHLKQAFFTSLRSLKFSDKISIILVSRPDISIRRLLAPLSHVCDICDDEEPKPRFYHCAAHADGGYDICESCYQSGLQHCPDEAHEAPILLLSANSQHFEPSTADINTYMQHRLQRHELWDKLKSRTDGILDQLCSRVAKAAGPR